MQSWKSIFAKVVPFHVFFNNWVHFHAILSIEKIHVLYMISPNAETTKKLLRQSEGSLSGFSDAISTFQQRVLLFHRICSNKSKFFTLAILLLLWIKYTIVVQRVLEVVKSEIIVTGTNSQKVCLKPVRKSIIRISVCLYEPYFSFVLPSATWFYTLTLTIKSKLTINNRLYPWFDNLSNRIHHEWSGKWNPPKPWARALLSVRTRSLCLVFLLRCDTRIVTLCYSVVDGIWYRIATHWWRHQCFGRPANWSVAAARLRSDSWAPVLSSKPAPGLGRTR